MKTLKKVLSYCKESYMESCAIKAQVEGCCVHSENSVLMF